MPIVECQPCQDVYPRNTDLGRPPVGLARNAHDAGHALERGVVARLRRPGPRLSKACDRCVDDPRVDPGDRLVVQPIPCEVADAEVLEQDVGPLGEIPDDLLTPLVPQVDDQALLAPVRRQVVRALRVHERRTPAPSVVPPGRLDLPDRRPQVRQDLRPERPRQDSGHVKYRNVAKRAHENHPSTDPKACLVPDTGSDAILKVCHTRHNTTPGLFVIPAEAGIQRQG